MSFIKILLIAFGLILLGMLAFPLIAFVYNALWYLFWIAVICIGGYAGYKWLTRESEPKLLAGDSRSEIGGLDEADRTFEDFKRRHLTK